MADFKPYPSGQPSPDDLYQENQWLKQQLMTNQPQPAGGMPMTTSMPGTRQRVETTINQQQAAQQLIDEYRQKHPDLAPFQDAIINEALAALAEANENGQNMDDRGAVEAGIDRFRSKLTDYIGKQNQQKNQQGYRQRLLKLDAGQIPQTDYVNVTQALKSIGDDDQRFAQYRQLYLKSKGL